MSLSPIAGASLSESSRRAGVALRRGGRLAFGRAPLVMGIINVTPDSFSDGGVHLDVHTAVAAALRMEEDGAAIIDVGGESTRPGAEPVPLETELLRVRPVIEGIRRHSGVVISVDTTKSEVAGAALDAGADIVNDVSALRSDPAMAGVIARSGAPVILMHMRGEPRTMQQNIHFTDVVREIRQELQEWRDRAVEAGVDASKILIDPGIGFGKTFDHNLEILARCDELRTIGPVVIGASRKAFVGHLTGAPAGASRAAGSLAAVAAAFHGHAAIVRVHDVRETAHFLRVLEAIDRSGAKESGATS